MDINDQRRLELNVHCRLKAIYLGTTKNLLYFDIVTRLRFFVALKNVAYVEEKSENLKEKSYGKTCSLSSALALIKLSIQLNDYNNKLYTSSHHI